MKELGQPEIPQHWKLWMQVTEGTVETLYQSHE